MSKEKLIGCLSVWKPDKNYGFLSVMCDDGTLDPYFLHASRIYSGVPKKGSIVRFEPKQGERGWWAARAEIFTNLQEMERSDAAAALTDSTTSTFPSTEVA